MQLTLELKKAIENNAFCSIATYLENNEIQNHLMWVDYKDDFLLMFTSGTASFPKLVRLSY